MDDHPQLNQACYPRDALESMGSGHQYTQWILSQFVSWIRGDVAEVGAGMGHVTRFLPRFQMDRLVVLEPDRGLSEILRYTIGNDEQVCLSSQTLLEYARSNPNEFFDALLYINVLEHIEEDEAELRLMAERLRPGGAALIFVPAFRCLFSHYDRRVGHCRRYTAPELRRKIKCAGLQLHELRYMDLAGFFIWFIACRLLRMQPSTGRVGLYDRFLVPVSRAIEARYRPPLGKNLLAIAVKEG